MQLLQQLLSLAIPLSLASLVLAVALDATLDDLLYLLRRPGMLARAVLAISVIVPVAAVVVVSLLPIGPISKAGIVLMAASPVPPLVPGKALKLGGRKCYVYGLYVAFALLTVVLAPATVAALAAWFGVDVGLSIAAVAEKVAISVLAPLAIGMAIRAWRPGLAAALAPWMSRLAMLLLLLVLVPLLIRVWPALSELIGDGTIFGIVAVVAVALAGGHLLGGPDRRDRLALAGAAATRHPGIAVMIASANGADKRVTAAIILFMLVGLGVVAVYQAVIRRGARDAEVPA